jgi:O-antigen ligase
MREAADSRPGSRSDSRSGGNLAARLLGAGFFVLVGLIAYFLMSRLGTQYFALAVIGVTALLFLAWISLRDLSLALMAWLFSMSGLRTLGMVRMPGLPDFSFDRFLLVWVILMFLLRAILERRRLRGPFLADILLLLHAVYVLIQLLFLNPPSFHSWVLSSLSPFFAYLYGKYVVSRERELRNLLYFFLVLGLYWSVTSIAEHFGWRALVWPKAILDPAVGFWAKGRSRGPVLHPPLFGQLIGLVSLVPFYFLTRPLRPVARILTGMLLASCLLGLFFAYTRGPWLATVVGILLLGVLRRRYRRVLLVFAVVGVIGGLVGAVQLANTEFFKERLENTHTIDNRVGFMASALRMARDHPLFGVGFFCYPEYRGFYNQTTLVPFYGLVRKADASTIAIHDIYIGRLAEEGLVSVGLLAAFTLVVLRAFLRKWRAAPAGDWLNRDTLALFAAMMVCYMVGGMIIDFRYFDLVNVFFFFLAGLVYGYPVVAGSPQGPGRAGRNLLRLHA